MTEQDKALLLALETILQVLEEVLPKSDLRMIKAMEALAQLEKSIQQ